ncbi:hypothetical protein BC332_20963 [Capsicum chinense]|nr:hypothetical protein BC332_20963 [Capsicum chinense]
MWKFRQDLFISWGKNPLELDFLRNVSRENWIWLDNVWLVNKDRFFSKFLDKKPKCVLLDEIDIDYSDDIDDSDNLDASNNIDLELDTELELLTRMNGITVDMMLEIDQFYITLQFELAK